MTATPPCATCRPELLPENHAAAAIYDRVADEWIIGPSGELVGVPAMNIEAAMRVCRVPAQERRQLLDEVKLISRVIAREIGEERKRKRDAETALRPHR